MAKQPHKKNTRRKKTVADVKATTARVKSRNINTRRNMITELSQDRERTQSEIRDAISGVLALTKTLSDDRIANLIPEDKYTECQEKISEFKAIANQTVPVIRQSINKMENIEKEMLNNPKNHEQHMMDYSITGMPMFQAALQLSQQSIETSVFCSDVIAQALPKDTTEETEVKEES